MRCPLKVFAGLVPSPLLVRSMPIMAYSSLQILGQAQTQAIVDVRKLQESLEAMHQELSIKNDKARIKAQQVYIAQKNVLPLNITIGDFVMVRIRGKRGQKLQTKWKGPL